MEVSVIASEVSDLGQSLRLAIWDSSRSSTLWEFEYYFVFRITGVFHAGMEMQSVPKHK